MADSEPKRKRSPPPSPLCEGMVAPAAKKPVPEPLCFGCKHGKASQKHHMYEGGCMSPDNIEKMLEK